MRYQAILLEQDNIFIIGDDIYFTFALRDSNGVLLTNLTGWTIVGKLSSAYGTETFSGVSYISTSGAKVTVYIPASSTEDLEENEKYNLIIEGALDNKTYTLGQFEVWFKEQTLNER